MLTIRLQRTGKRNTPLYRVIVAEKTASASKSFVEVLGNYNPHSKDLQIKQDRLAYWTAQHIEMSPTVHNLLVGKKLIDDKKVKAFTLPKKAVEAAPVVPVEAKPAEAPAAEASAENAPDAPAEA